MVAASPQRISSTDNWVRSVIIESASGNAGELYVADSEMKATSTNRHTLYNPGDHLIISGAEYAELDAKINLREIWIHGDTVSDRFVISYVDITERLF